MKNLTKSFFVGSFMFLSALGFSQKALIESPNGANIQEYVSQSKFNLSEKDIQGLIVNNEYYSKGMDATLVYVGQEHQGIPIYNAISTVAIKDGQIFHIANRFVDNVAEKVNAVTPAINAQQAIEKVASHFKLGAPKGLRSLSRVKNNYEFSGSNISSRDVIPVKLKYVQEADGSLRLYQDVEIDVIGGHDMWSVRIDAVTGEISDRNIHNYTISCAFENPNEDNGLDHSQYEAESAEDKFNMFKPNTSMMVDGSSYKVFPLKTLTTPGLMSPSHGQRQTVNAPANINASPFGWHDTNGRAGAEFTITRGNNVYAYLDLKNEGNGNSPDGGNDLKFDFPFNGNQEPSQLRDAAVTNLFYGNNMIHDVWYEAGFDEVAGNFQENNYGNGGKDSDSVNAEAQDGGGTNNANMGTRADGTNPRMQMYIWTRTNPDRDGDFDNGIVIHEYGHGISTRLAGGPGTAGCLGGQEQQGEGWSDWFALMMTINPGDEGSDRRGMGTYSIGQGNNGTGIRRRPYSTNFNINEFTYNDIKSQVAPHGVGSVWATMLWDLTWAYIDKFGYSEDTFNGDAGNNKVMQLVLDGLKLQPCRGGFVDSRDAILAADRATTGGENACLIWEVFAKRGLGFSADQNDPGDKSDGREAFDLPESDIIITKIKDECGSEVPQIQLTNFSNNPVTEVEYTFKVDDGPENDGVWTGSIGACESAPITIDLGNLSRGAHIIEVNTINPAANATATIVVNDKGEEDEVNTFENGSDELIAFNATGNNSLWERGDAAGTVLSSAVAGNSKVYGTDLNGDHGNDTTAYLMSQCYDLSKSQEASVEFFMAFDIENRYDLLTFESSKDGGQTWAILGTANDPDWFNGDGVPGGNDCQSCVGAQWYGEGNRESSHSDGGTNAEMKKYSHTLNEFDSSGSAEENMLFRFAYISDRGVTEEGVIIDNFVIRGNTTLSVNDIEIEGLEIYPNPTTDVITIQSATSLEDAKVTVIDITGRVLTNVSINTIGANKKTVSLKQFASGVYLLNIDNGSRKSTKRIVKK